MSATTTGRREHGVERTGMMAKAGPALLALGIGWLVFSLAIPQLGLRTVKSMAVLLGLLLLAAALGELSAATTAARDWRPTHAVMAVVFLTAGIVALVWPSPTIPVVARILAWSLLAKGIRDIATAFVQRRTGRERATFGTDSGNLPGGSPWWAPLAIGAFSIAIAFWAASYQGLSTNLLILWIGLAALSIGLTKIAAAFWSRSEVEEGFGELPPSGYGTRAAAESARTTGADTRVRPPSG